ncbi:motile sperm domain-containing protein 1-like [Daktulosphaira vitifoliae]|uniref:motile sperm domain-containing protein 1-like n=1 Tax=Daktulosphaira vitifoliae TaxID=58002 RepID=UPI0021A9BEBF|nr:motile sperm domain-containing protein 1-like [Daktulosphaira vitifoliae]
MNNHKVPVFVSPQSLTFSLDDKTSHRQIITLFNPYDFPVRFKVFCTCTKKYTVVEPEGSISASSRVDIVVRHNAPAPAFCDIRDKFRIQMQYYTTKKTIGHKDVETILVRSSDNFEPPAENFKQLPKSDFSADSYENDSDIRQNFSKSSSGPNYTTLLMAGICICGLLLQSSEETDIMKFRISFNLKLAFAFVLGMTTITILQHQ